MYQLARTNGIPDHHVKAITQAIAKKQKKEQEFDNALDVKFGVQPVKCVVDAVECSRKEELREVESEDIAENEMVEDAQGGE